MIMTASNARLSYCCSWRCCVCDCVLCGHPASIAEGFEGMEIRGLGLQALCKVTTGILRLQAQTGQQSLLRTSPATKAPKNLKPGSRSSLPVMDLQAHLHGKSEQRARCRSASGLELALCRCDRQVLTTTQ